jgi:maleate cis-trans isomerase
MMYGSRARFGYLSGPIFAESYAYEFYRMAPPGVTLMISTLKYEQGTMDEIKACVELGDQIVQDMAKAGATVIIQGVVPINLAFGPQFIDDWIERTQQRCGVPATTSVTTQMHALQAVGARKVAVLQVGPTPVKGLNEYMQSFGFEVLGGCAGNFSLVKMSTEPPSATMAVAREVLKAYPDADTVYAPAPHLPFVVNIDELERETGKTVIAAGQAIMWEGLRLSGVTDSVAGYGKLLSEH